MAFKFNVFTSALDYYEPPGGGTIPDGTNTGDIVRWNAGTSAWEAKVEPLDFTQINLTPTSAAIDDVKGGMYYSNVNDSIYVCTSDV